MSEYINAGELHDQLGRETQPIIIDVRGAEEYEVGHLPGALHIPGDELAGQLRDLPRGKPVVTY